MNKLLQQKPKFVVLFVLFCAVALLADAGNVTDWFSEWSTIHFEEGDGLTAEAQLAAVSAAITPSLGLYSASAHKNFCLAKPPAFRHVVFDQDSPSLEAVSLLHATIWARTPDDKELPPYHVFLSSSLYLENCSLLI